MVQDMTEAKRPEEKAAETVRVAVVGCGGWGKNLVRNFAELGALEAVVDVNPDNAQALATQHNVRSENYEAVLADAQIDAVVIAAPPEQHYLLAKQALEAGKHVYVEKPLTLELGHAEELVAMADRLDRRLMVGHLLQYHPVFLELKRLVSDGKLGRLLYAYSNRLNLGKIRIEEDIMWSFAPHDISMILSLIGSKPNAVTATGSYFLNETIADTTTMHLAFPGGERAHIFVSWLHPFKEQKLVLIGAEAMAVFNDSESWDRKLLLYPHRVEWKGQMPTPNKADAVPIDVPQGEPLKQECQHFLDCVASGKTPNTDGHEGLRVLRVLHEATEALLESKSKAAKGAAENSQSVAGPKPRVAGSHPGVTIHETAYVDDGVRIGEGSKLWHFSHVLGDVEIGEKCSIGQNVVVGPKVTIGNRVKIQNNVSVYQGVTLEDGVFCGPSCVFTNVNNPRAEISRMDEVRPTLVKRGTTIGANATIVCGHTLGEYSFIAAGAVVAGDVPAFALMAGVPAKRIGWMSKAGGRLGPDLVCPIDGTRYKELDNERLVPEGT